MPAVITSKREGAVATITFDRASEGNVIVIDSWSFDTPSTRGAKAALAALGLTGKKVLVVCGPDDLNVALSFRNLADTHPILATELNAYDVLVSDVVLFTKATLPNTTPATAVEVSS